MTDIVQADIFFFVATIAVGVVSIAFVVLIYYLVKLLQDVRHVVQTVQDEINKLIIKRQKIEIQALTFKKILGALAQGKLFRNKGQIGDE